MTELDTRGSGGNDFPEVVRPAPRVPRARDLGWRSTLAKWFVIVPIVAVAVFWIGYGPHVGDKSQFVWPVSMWVACLVLMPMAIVGAVWGHRAGSARTRLWGIVAAVLCLPGWVMGVFMLGVVIF